MTHPTKDRPSKKRSTRSSGPKSLSRERVLEFIKKCESPPLKRDIIKALRLKGEWERRRLKFILRELSDEGLYTKNKPMTKRPEKVLAPSPTRAALPETLIGTLESTDLGLKFIPAHRKLNIAFRVENAGDFDAMHLGAVFRATLVSEDPPVVKVESQVGETSDISLLVSHIANLPMTFSEESTDYAKKGRVPDLGKREDLRKHALVTFDGKDSRDFDDAVWAAPDTDPKNKGGWHIIVAIADVAHYVKPGSVLDQEAYTRGTSVYFPDRVIPMLPEVLSNGLCSLNPKEDRACLAAHIWIDKHGKKINQKFSRALMRSSARLTYEEAQRMHEDPHHPGHDQVASLYGVFYALQKARVERGTLEIEVPEPYVVFDDDGFVKEMVSRERLDSHRLIEELMILANVAAAETLEKATLPCMYRVHDSPDPEKIQELQKMLARLKVDYKGALKSPQDLTRLLRHVKDTANQNIVNELVLRSQSQALYSPKNLGHFGLNLDHYAHFTSPIRRYADILVHRALLRTLGYPEDALPEKEGALFEEHGSHISIAERRAQGAERDAMDRYMAHYLSGREGESFEVYITGITKSGLFVTIPDLNASGIVFLKLMTDDYYIYREHPTRLEGRRTRRSFGFGDPMTVRLLEVDLTKGRLNFEPVMESAPKKRYGKHVKKGPRKVRR